MASRLWRRIDEERAQQKAEEERKRAATAADWVRLRSFFQARLSELRAPLTITFRHYVLPEALYVDECAWWPAGRVEELERKLFEADRRGRVTGWHVHRTFSVPNPTVRTLWLLKRAEEEGGDDAKLAMLIRALFHYRCARGFETRLSDEVWLKAYEALRCVHPVMAELDWFPGSKDVLPTDLRWQQPPHDLTGLARLLGDDAADLLQNWVPVRIQDSSVSERKSEPT